MPEQFGGAASRKAAKEYGGIFKDDENIVNVGVTQIAAIPADPNRISLLLVNNGTTNITLTRQPGITSGRGILLLGNGATFSANVFDDGDLPAFQFYAISDLAGGVLYWLGVVQSGSDDRSAVAQG